MALSSINIWAELVYEINFDWRFSKMSAPNHRNEPLYELNSVNFLLIFHVNPDHQNYSYERISYELWNFFNKNVQRFNFIHSNFYEQSFSSRQVGWRIKVPEKDAQGLKDDHIKYKSIIQYSYTKTGNKRVFCRFLVSSPQVRLSQPSALQDIFGHIQ